MDVAFIHFMIQFLSTAGVFCLFGLILWLSNRLFYFFIGERARAVCVATGIVGTPVHEIGHAIFCVLFFHKIDKISFFQPNNDDGVLGYVNHSYNRRNPYQQLGNFFIGIGPILFGGALLLVFLRFLVPDLFFEFVSKCDHITLSNCLQTTFSGLTILFRSENYKDGFFWIFLILAALISLHMSLSLADVKTGLVGLLYLVLLLFGVDVVLFFFFPNVQNALSLACLRIGMFSVFFFSVALAISLLLNFVFVWTRIKKRG